MLLRGTLLGIVASALMLVAAPAQAGHLSKVDRAHDVRKYDLGDGLAPALPGTRLRHHAQGDLERYRVNYGHERITVALRFGELQRTKGVRFFDAQFQYPGDGQLLYSEAIVKATRKDPAGQASMDPVSCKVTHRIRYREDSVILSFPRSCFGAPRWVRFNAWAFSLDRQHDPRTLLGDSVFPVLSDDRGSDEAQYTRKIRRPVA